MIGLILRSLHCQRKEISKSVQITEPLFWFPRKQNPTQSHFRADKSKDWNPKYLKNRLDSEGAEVLGIKSPTCERIIMQKSSRTPAAKDFNLRGGKVDRSSAEGVPLPAREGFVEGLDPSPETFYWLKMVHFGAVFKLDLTKETTQLQEEEAILSERKHFVYSNGIRKFSFWRDFVLLGLRASSLKARDFASKSKAEVSRRLKCKL